MTQWVTFGEVLTADRAPVDIDPLGNYRPIGVRGFGRGILDYAPVAGSDLGKLRYFELGPERLVVSNIKGWEGAVALTSADENGRIASNRFLQFMSADPEITDPGYLRHWLLSDPGIEALGRASPGSADRNRTLSLKNFVSIRVPLPQITEQRRIAAHLDEMAALPTRAEGRSGAELLWEALLGAPPAGCRTSLADLVQEVKRPVAADPDVIYPMFGVRWYGEGLFERETKRGSELSAKTVFRVEPGDLVYNRLFAWKQSFAIAGEAGGFVSNEFPIFRIDESSVRPEVLHYLLLTRSFTAEVNAASSGSTPTSRNRLKVEDFLHLTVDVPPSSVQDQLVETLRLMQAARRAQERRSTHLSALLPAARNEIFSALR